MSRISRLAGLCVAACALLGPASAAQAACYSSTPASASFADSPVDGQSSLAPEITTVTGTLDASCTYSVSPGLTNSLISGDAVFIYIDRDGNPATGDPLFFGADIAVGTLGVTGAAGPPLLGVWDGTQIAFNDPNPVGAARSDGGFAATVDRLGLSNGTLSKFGVGTIYSGIYSSYIDAAPEPGMGGIGLPVAYTTTPPAPAPVAQPIVQTPPATSTARCRVPVVRRKTRSAARNALLAAGCRVASTARSQYSSTVRKGRVMRTSPAAGSRTTKRVELVISKGRRRTGHARAAAASTLQVSSTVLARLQMLANSDASKAAARR